MLVGPEEIDTYPLGITTASYYPMDRSDPELTKPVLGGKQK